MVKGDHSQPFLLLALFPLAFLHGQKSKRGGWVAHVILVSSLVPIGLWFFYFFGFGIGIGTRRTGIGTRA